MSRLVRRARETDAPAHLAKWFDPGLRKGTKFAGEIALRQKFWVYRTYVQVLSRRYRPQCSGNIERVESALAKVLGQSPEVVRKHRQSLARELKRAEAP